MANQREIQVSIDSDSDNYHVLGDKVRLKQVLFNLLSNAVKYNSEAGTVKITLEEKNNELLSCSVSDSGVGMTQSEVDSLFQPFNRLGAQNSEIEGTGIGLVITKRLVEMMGGELSVRSTPGEGSCFSFTLLRAEATTVTETKGEFNTAFPSGSLMPGSESYTVLYIEDNPANIRLMKKALERIPNIKLVTKMIAEEGLAFAVSNQPDLILMDINLPGMNGLEALGQLQGIIKTKHIPVIAITADALPALKWTPKKRQ